MKGKLKIDELTFSAAHYIRGHPKCQALHGHTYFVREIEVDYEAPEQEFVDLGIIKSIISFFDHKLLIPLEDEKFWLGLSANIDNQPPCRIPYVIIPGNTTVESLSEYIAEQIKTIPNVKYVRLKIYEGPNQGATYQIGGEQ